MSSVAYAFESSGRLRQRARSRRDYGVNRLAAPVVRRWSEVSVALPDDAVSGTPAGRRRPGFDILALVALVVAAHVGVAWYLIHHRVPQAVQPEKHEVDLALERPPPPKIEPPKPPPPPPRVQRVAKIVPQIEEAPPVPSAAPRVEAPEPPVAVAPVAVAAPPSSLPVTPPIGRAGYLNNPAPPYPPVAARLGLEGTVLLRVRVLSSGRVDSVQVQKSSGSQALDDAAVLTVKKWLFTPSKRGDTPIDGWATVPIEFKLDQ